MRTRLGAVVIAIIAMTGGALQAASAEETTTTTSSTSTTSTSTTTTTTIPPSTTTTAPPNSTTTSTTAKPATTTTVASSSAPVTRAGGTVEVTAIGYRPNSTGTIDFESTPQRVGTFTADGNGNVAVDVKIPRNATAGVHYIVLSGVDPNGATRTLSVAVNVAGIARSGAPTTTILLIAAALVILGVIARLRAGDMRHGALTFSR